MKHDMDKVTAKLIIRQLERQDIELLRTWRNDSREYFFNKEIISRDAQVGWYERYINKSNDYMFTAVDRKTNKICGFAGVYDFKDKQCEFGRIVTGENAGRGIGTEMTMAICELVFDNYGVGRIVSEVLVSNIASNRMFIKAGFSLIKEKDNINYYEKRRI